MAFPAKWVALLNGQGLQDTVEVVVHTFHLAVAFWVVTCGVGDANTHMAFQG